MAYYGLNQSAMPRAATFWAVVVWLGILIAPAMIEQPRLATIGVAPFTALTATEFESVSFIDDGTNASSISTNRAIGKNETARLFGMETEPVEMGELPEKWRQMQVAIARDLAILAQCHANGPCPLPAQRLVDISAQGAGRTGRIRVGLINRAADLAISPTSDQVQWGAADHWSDPLETLQSNRGDCEDYAIVKYVALLNAGFSKDDVQIVIFRNLFPNEDHAAVATRVDGQWLILDNRTLTLVRDTDVKRAIPEFVLDHEGVKRFNWASRNRRVTS